MSESRQVKHLRALFIGWLCVFWTAAAWAAQDTFISGVHTIPAGAVAIALVLAMVGGAAHTAAKVASPVIVLKSIAAEIVRDVITSIVVGLIVFFAGAWQEWPLWLHCILITLGGYGGSRVLEPALSVFIDRIKGTGGKS